LDNLNYKIEIKGLLNSSSNSPKHLKSSFLKRIIHNNLLDTKLEDVFDKLLFGSIKCKPKVSKKAYNFRRLKDLVVADRDDVLVISKYYAFIDLLDGKGKIVEDIFDIFIKILIEKNLSGSDCMSEILCLLNIESSVFDDLVKFYFKEINYQYDKNVLHFKPSDGYHEA